MLIHIILLTCINIGASVVTCVGVGGVLCDPPVFPVHALPLPGSVECDGGGGGHRPSGAVATQYTGMDTWIGTVCWLHSDRGGLGIGVGVEEVLKKFQMYCGQKNCSSG